MLKEQVLPQLLSNTPGYLTIGRNIKYQDKIFYHMGIRLGIFLFVSE